MIFWSVLNSRFSLIYKEENIYKIEGILKLNDGKSVYFNHFLLRPLNE